MGCEGGMAVCVLGFSVLLRVHMHWEYIILYTYTYFMSYAFPCQIAKYHTYQVNLCVRNLYVFVFFRVAHCRVKGAHKYGTKKSDSIMTLLSKHPRNSFYHQSICHALSNDTSERGENPGNGTVSRGLNVHGNCYGQIQRKFSERSDNPKTWSPKLPLLGTTRLCYVTSVHPNILEIELKVATLSECGALPPIDAPPSIAFSPDAHFVVLLHDVSLCVIGLWQARTSL